MRIIAFIAYVLALAPVAAGAMDCSDDAFANAQMQADQLSMQHGAAAWKRSAVFESALGDREIACGHIPNRIAMAYDFAAGHYTMLHDKANVAKYARLAIKYASMVSRNDQTYDDAQTSIKDVRLDLASLGIKL